MFESANYKKFLTILEEIEYLQEALGLLAWDQETMMPEGALESRAKQKAALAGVVHEKFTAKNLGGLGEEIEKEYQRSGVKDAFVEANLREFFRSYRRETKVPKSLVETLQEAETKAHEAWVQAREQNDFSIFSPHLKKLLELRQQESKAIDPARKPYDVQLEKFEVGLTGESVAKLFETLKVGLLEFIQKLQSSKKKLDSKILEGRFSVERQREFAFEIAQTMGFDPKRGRMDVSIHPFCGGAGPADVRITTRYREDNFSESLFGVIHETGHAIYEQGLDLKRITQPIGSARSMGVHESQSLLWEKRVGLSREFWQFYFPCAKKHFAPALDSLTFETFYEALHVVAPSLIRVSADEVTYPLHIILRFELEQDLFEGRLKVDGLPEAWNLKMKKYLGLTPTDNQSGVLQDVHWSFGLFGYFPTYNLGAIYASQIFHAVEKAIPSFKTEMAQGKFSSLKEWLNREVHQRGCLLETDELIRIVTGETINVNAHLDNLRKKYGEIYGI